MLFADFEEEEEYPIGDAAEQLQQQKIPAAVIGFLSADNDRVIVNGEERRFLEPANTDAIYRME